MTAAGLCPEGICIVAWLKQHHHHLLQEHGEVHLKHEVRDALHVLPRAFDHCVGEAKLWLPEGAFAGVQELLALLRGSSGALPGLAAGAPAELEDLLQFPVESLIGSWSSILVCMARDLGLVFLIAFSCSHTHAHTL